LGLGAFSHVLTYLSPSLSLPAVYPLQLRGVKIGVGKGIEILVFKPIIMRTSSPGARLARDYLINVYIDARLLYNPAS